MNENKEFDDYIKGLFKTDPEVPSELEWDAMEFDFPDKPNNGFAKNGKKYLIALLVLLMIFPVIYFSINKQNADKLNSSALVAEQALNEEISSKVTKQTAKLNNENAVVENVVQKESKISQEEKSTVGKFTSNDKELKTNQEPQKSPAVNKLQNKTKPFIAKQPQVVKKASTEVVSTKKPGIQKEAQSILSKESNSSIVEEPVNVVPSPRLTKQNPRQTIKNTHIKTTENSVIKESNKPENTRRPENDFDQKSLSNINKPIANFTDGNVKSDKTKSLETNDLETKVIVKTKDTAVKPLPSIWNQDLSQLSNPEIKLEHKSGLLDENQLDTKKKFKINEVYVGYGHIRFSLDTSQTDPIKYIINGAPSNFYKVGIKRNLGKKWVTNAGLIYYRYHTTLQYTRDLEPIYTASLKVNRKEVTFHNNFTNTVGLQLGIARKWNLGSRLQFYTGMGISTSYTLSATGKTVDDLLVGPITYDEKVRIIAVNASPRLGLVYPVNPSLDVELAYENDKFIATGIFINNGISVKQQGAFSASVSYKFIK